MDQAHAAIHAAGSDSTTAVPIAMTLLLVFGAAKLLAELFEMLGQPGIAGEILAGVLLGPSLLNAVKPDPTLCTLSELGVLFLLFRVGMEMQPSQLIRIGGMATWVATAGVVLPFVLGWAAASAAGRPPMEAVFVSASLVATSVGITAQALSVKGLLQRRASRIILGAAVVDDILGLLVLAVAGGGSGGRIDWPKIALTGGVAVCFVLAALFIGAPGMRRLAPRLSRTLRAGEREFAVAMVVLFALAVFAESAGVAAIVGAFLAGSIFAETASRRIRDISHGTTELLAPFFLVSIGLHVDLREFADPKLALAAMGLIVIAVVSKMVGCGLAALRLGRTEAFQIGVGMVPRGEVGMIVAQMGLGIGALSTAAYSAIVLMAASTTLLAPPLLSFAFQQAGAGPEAEEIPRIG